MPNKGIFPIDPTTEVGKLRALVGDTDSIPLSPAEVGYADYNVWSDLALETALAVQGGNQLRAAGTLYLQLAAEYAMSGRSVKTDDLAIDTKSRGSDLRQIAQWFFDEDDRVLDSDAADFFEIVPFGGRRGRGGIVRPEATPWPLC